MQGAKKTKYTIELPSVTTILNIIGKPALVPWAYKYTIAGVAELAQAEPHKFVNITADELDTLMKEHQLTPNQMKENAAKRGTNVHEEFERLLNGEPPLAPENGYVKALIHWIDTRHPVTIATEAPLWSVKHGFAGTLDLVWTRQDGATVLTDLKTSKAVYDSMAFQLDGYRTAWEEMGGDHIDATSILLVRENGTHHEQELDAPRGIFLNALETYHTCKYIQKQL